MVKILIIANASNRAKIFLPVADMLADSGAKITFVSLDPVLYGDASNILKISRHPYIELPFRTEKNLLEMSLNERFDTFKKIRKPVEELLSALSPDLILLGAAAYVEGLIIEEAIGKNIKTALMQDGLRIYKKTSLIENFSSWLENKSRSIVNEWTLALCGMHYFFTPFETNRVDRILVFGETTRKELLRKGVEKGKLVVVGNPVYDSISPISLERGNDVRFFFGLPPERNVALFGMQCFHRHKVVKLDDEIAVVKNLVDLFREIPAFDLIIKLHPDNDYELYREHFSRWDPPHTVHLVKDEFSPRELLSISNVFMTVYSTMALESLVYGIPVITLDYTPVKFHLNLEPAIIRAKSPSELKKILNDWNDKTSMLMKDKIKETLNRQLANLGFASEKAAKAILKLAKNPS